MKNIITGPAQTDGAVWVVAADVGELEAGISKMGRPVSMPFWLTLGVNQLLIGANKLDSSKPRDSQKRQEGSVKEVSTYIKDIGYSPDTGAFVPIPDWKGDSVLESRANTPWFKRWEVT